jgi:hypothetical protein
MLYRLSYASKLRDRAFSDANLPTDPTQMTGTIFKVTITANGVQPIPYPRSDPGSSSVTECLFARSTLLPAVLLDRRCYHKRFLCALNADFPF